MCPCTCCRVSRPTLHVHFLAPNHYRRPYLPLPFIRYPPYLLSSHRCRIMRGVCMCVQCRMCMCRCCIVTLPRPMCPLSHSRPLSPLPHLHLPFIRYMPLSPLTTRVLHYVCCVCMCVHCRMCVCMRCRVSALVLHAHLLVPVHSRRPHLIRPFIRYLPYLLATHVCRILCGVCVCVHCRMCVCACCGVAWCECLVL